MQMWRSFGRIATRRGGVRHLLTSETNAVAQQRIARKSLAAAYAVAGVGLAVAAVISYDGRREYSIAYCRQSVHVITAACLR